MKLLTVNEVRVDVNWRIDFMNLAKRRYDTFLAWLYTDPVDRSVSLQTLAIIYGQLTSRGRLELPNMACLNRKHCCQPL